MVLAQILLVILLAILAGLLPLLPGKKFLRENVIYLIQRLILESFMLHGKASFKFVRSYSWFRNSFIFVAPLIPISRFFLNYHSFEQVKILI